MAAFSDTFENALLDHIFHPPLGQQVWYTYLRTAMVVALWIGDPTDTGSGGAEVSGGGYGRLTTVPDNWTMAVYGTIANSVSLVFLEATAPWGTVENPVSHFALFNTGGYMLFHGPLTESRVVEVGQVAVFPPPWLAIALD